MNTQKRDQKHNILVVGASRGSGRATVEQLLGAGHRVTAFARRVDDLDGLSGRLVAMPGDATHVADVERAVAGQDAVIVTLGISDNPVRVRLLGAAGTPIDVRSQGTKNVISAMEHHGVRRLVVQTSYGVGETRDKLRLVDRLFFALVLKPQIEDTELQEQLVRASSLDWVLAQPVHLTDSVDQDTLFVSSSGETRGMKASRHAVARFLVEAATTGQPVGQSIALSAA